MATVRKIAIMALVFAVTFTVLVYWWADFLPWWAYPIIFLVVAGFFIQGALETAALQRIIDGRDEAGRQ
jgi:hypothetical protein